MTPLRTVEARWFLRGALPAAARAWFDGLGPPVEPEARTDRYLRPASDALGLKLREGRVEAKRRDAVLDAVATGRAAATAEAWTKWSFLLAEVPAVGDDWLAIRKARRQRRLAAGEGGCALELSEVEAAGAAWWSVCLEADGPTLHARLAALAVGADHWLASSDAPELSAELAMGYPAWLLAVW